MKDLQSVIVVLGCSFLIKLSVVSSNQICEAFDQGACPSDTCCKQSICDDEGGTYKCCTDDGIGCSNCPTCVDCVWAEWLDFPYSYPGPRADGSTTTKCKNLVCNGDGMSPEKGYGEKNRKIKFQAGPGGKECDCSEGKFCTKASCRDPCPEHCQLDDGWEEWIWEDEERKCGVRRRTRKVKLEANHGGDSCEKKYPTDYTEEKFEACLNSSSDEKCGTKVCIGKEKCCKIQTCADKCYLGLKDPDPQTWTCEEVCPIERLDCQDYIANHCRNFGSNYTQCGLLHATKSNCGKHHCIGYMGTNNTVLHGYCKPRRVESEVCGTANAPSPNGQHKVFLGSCMEPNDCINNKCIRRGLLT